MKRLFFVALSVVLLFTACKEKEQKVDSDTFVKDSLTTEVIDFQRDDISYETGRYTPEFLWHLGRIGGVSVSPDGNKILFGVSYYSVKENKSSRDLYTMNLDGSDLKQITHTAAKEYSETWRPDGKKIAFLSLESGSMQLWEMNADGTERVQITNVEEGISNYLYAPDLSKLLYTKDVKVTESVQDIYPDLPLANARIYDDLMIRHWDVWEDDLFSHIFIADLKNGKLENDKDIMANEPYDAPMKPWGGIEEIAWNPNSKEIAYTCKKLFGKEYALSTNSEIFIYNTETGLTTNLTEGNKGYDKAPVYSPDGAKIAWHSMERDGFEADKNRLMVYDFAAKTKTDYTQTIDQSAGEICWANDSKTIYFISGIQATEQIFAVSVESKEVKQITQGDHDYLSIAVAGEKFIAQKQSMLFPTEIFAVNISDGKDTQISFINKEDLDKVKSATVEKRWIKTTDGKDMLVWVIYPPDFDKNKQYPALLYCQGGPQSAVSQFFSYRWNFQIMAANDYIIVAPNRRGLPSFGQEWNDQISKDYGGQNMKDYLSAIDALKAEPFVDDNRLGAVGASYGGFSVYWLAGNHQKRFKAFIAHCGIFNFESMYGSTEELFFSDWDMGGSYWNRQAKNSYDASPHLFVKNWDTPILVVHGEKDFRIPYTQAMNAFTAAQLMNVPSRFLSFPEENHWVLSPQNGVLWQREFFSWLDKYLK